MEFFRVSDLANCTGKTIHAIKKMEYAGIIPEPNFRGTPKFIGKPVDDISADEFLLFKEVYQKYVNGNREEFIVKKFKEGIERKQIVIGERLYSEYLFDDLCELLKKVSQGKETSETLKKEIAELFKREREVLKEIY